MSGWPDLRATPADTLQNPPRTQGVKGDKRDKRDKVAQQHNADALLILISCKKKDFQTHLQPDLPLMSIHTDDKHARNYGKQLEFTL